MERLNLDEKLVEFDRKAAERVDAEGGTRIYVMFDGYLVDFGRVSPRVADDARKAVRERPLWRTAHAMAQAAVKYGRGDAVEAAKAAAAAELSLSVRVPDELRAVVADALTAFAVERRWVAADRAGEWKDAFLGAHTLERVRAATARKLELVARLQERAAANPHAPSAGPGAG